MRRGRGKHRRRSIRLPGYDYAQPGAYSVTVCTRGGVCLFGDITGGNMMLNPAGEMVWHWWRELPRKYPQVEIDAAVVMPNHFHGIIMIVGQRGAVAEDAVVGATPCGRPDSDRPEGGVDAVEEDVAVGATLCGRPHGDRPVAAPTLGQIVGWFKTMTTNEYIRSVKQRGWPPFPGKVWQRNYYEHIIRNREALARIRRYILTNPERWELDRENPQRKGLDELEVWVYRFPAGREVP